MNIIQGCCRLAVLTGLTVVASHTTIIVVVKNRTTYSRKCGGQFESTIFCCSFFFMYVSFASIHVSHSMRCLEQLPIFIIRLCMRGACYKFVLGAGPAHSLAIIYVIDRAHEYITVFFI